MVERRRNLRGGGRKRGGQPLTQALHFQEIPAVVRPQRHWLDTHPAYQLRRVPFENHPADAFFAFRQHQIQCRRLRYPPVLGNPFRFASH
jgi:hypothetical protein